MTHALNQRVFEYNQEVIDVLESQNRADTEYHRDIPMHEPQPLPVYVAWYHDLVLTPIPHQFKRVRVRGRGRGRGYTILEIEDKTVLPDRKAKGIAPSDLDVRGRGLTEAEAEGLDWSSGWSVGDGGASLVAIGAGKPSEEITEDDFS